MNYPQTFESMESILKDWRDTDLTLELLSKMLKCSKQDIPSKAKELISHIEELEKEIKAVKKI